jgi:hypothetical protein
MVISHDWKFDPELRLLYLGCFPERKVENYISIKVQQDTTAHILEDFQYFDFENSIGLDGRADDDHIEMVTSDFVKDKETKQWMIMLMRR